jgi:hypothetical protein
MRSGVAGAFYIHSIPEWFEYSLEWLEALHPLHCGVV